MNMEEKIAAYADYQRAICKAPDTIRWDVQSLRMFHVFIEQEQITNLAEVDDRVMLKFQIYVSMLQNRSGRHYKPQTQNHIITAVRKFYRYLRRKREVFADPTADVELAKTVRSLPRTILTVSEVLKLLRRPDTRRIWGLRDRAILETMYSTAMRVGEIAGLDVINLNRDAGTIFIREGKGGRDRVVPCGQTAWRWIDEYLHKVRPLIVSDDNEPCLFLGVRSERLHSVGIRKMLGKYVQQAGIRRHITPHSIRASVATHLCDAGCDIRYVQELLGHSSPTTTAIYISVAIRRLKQVHAQYHPREKMAENIA